MENTTARRGENGDKTGKYELIARIYDANIDPGDTVVVDIYITGYGQIANSKLALYPPISILADSGSAVSYGFDYQQERVRWGGHTTAVSERGIVLPTAGPDDEPWPGYTRFFDVSEDPAPRIVTEASQGDNGTAPYTLNLRLSSRAKSGDYNVTLVFTYFNGETWQTSRADPKFAVRNVFERNERVISILGVLAAIGSIPPIFRVGYSLWEWLSS
ncbi:hypothetical protein [Hymenobacter psychrophilus]|uniref:DUF8164 domain-containing protein n=1 Tax=Hymenobacter psychrophilus TaxID=651662 RepID=A0A1H3JIR2_9BACT|nr:hypothetical protein [Hymenobacter psychrophilus]SDY39806.1 hypothetical protein SAMN04488069_108100 [Hymenobacter psychrophilus]